MIGEIEKYSLYEFEIFEHKEEETSHTKFYYYKIYTDDRDHNYWLNTNVLRESDEYFDGEQEARFAAIGHIDALENGEG